MMNNKFAKFILFTLGVALGSATTWQYVKKKYEQIAQEEIDSVKNAFLNRENDIEHEENEEVNIQIQPKQSKEKPNITEYAAKLQELGYTNYSDMKSVRDDDKEEEKKSMIVDKPYVISPEEFGDFDDYERISLIYYSDQVLADDDDKLVEDVEDVIGFEALNSFGEYEDDSVFVRNDRLKCDYEILLDQRKFSDVISRKPHGVND